MSHTVDFVEDDGEAALTSLVDTLGVLAALGGLHRYRVGTIASHHVVDDVGHQ